ncbi:bifunctional adenosylcobinamide kinase/adenosylcobinamide-phosphate guanylyltransferase [Marinitoga sp. 1155]|uniref:bifunctional adenosylcobinamide kinase/adenosylcobinamide-phosphate guanylyltransferase n=1 Tax=Marinitoga sp. 1155 TaxID=1428448 RepID=UPI0006417E19|nr:bifunctional adenosylcobinamide kinase/adenosylcobinamide-phosphate guanylyltransferase [Marinitoga sp. 1155]KLO22302.1 adenosylcobinamide kinase [Marinitoga sp. 1155]
MAKIIMVTGGARSGKSTFAQKIAKKFGNNILYIATAIPFDDGMRDRIKKHKNARPKDWKTLEQFKNFDNLLNNEEFLISDTIIFECMTLMVSNLLLKHNVDFDKIDYNKIDEIEKEIFVEVEKLIKIIKIKEKNMIIVTNEVGMGIVPSYKLGNIFRDIAGRINQYLAKNSDEVYITISGIPLKLK